jgi:protein-tyrosine phosphatase
MSQAVPTILSSGMHNLRDLGGLCAANGRPLRRAMLYRSGTISLNSEDDARAFSRLGLGTIIDLRGPSERERRPYLWCARYGISYWASDIEGSGASLSQLFRLADTQQSRVLAEMLALYRELPYSLAPAYSALLRALSEDTTPLLFCCAAGKDRTGVAAMLLLSLLGVGWDEIVEDYKATNASIGRLKHMAAEYLQTDPDAERLRPVLVADPDYLGEAMTSIRQRCGSLETYFADVLDVDADCAERIRGRLLDHAQSELRRD